MRKRGFTLIELIIVMAIISILVLFGMPKYKEYTNQARITKLTVEAKELEQASQKYYIVNNDWPRLNEDDAYSKAEVLAFGDKIYSSTGKVVELEDGDYYDIDYVKIGKYISKPTNPENYILQNPVGNVYSIQGVKESRKLIFNEDLPDEIIEEIGAGNIKKISAGVFHTVILMKDGTVKTCGMNERGLLGFGYSSAVFTKTFTTIPGLTGVIDIEAGTRHTVAIKEDGTVWTWGYNYYGQLGVGSKSDSAKPLKVPNLENVKQVVVGNDHTLALMTDGTVKGWGYNYYRQLGVSGITESVLPITIPDLENVKELVATNHTNIAILNDGTVKGWGNNEYGQLGVGETLRVYSPTEIIDFKDAQKIELGTYHTVALMRDGTIKVCGDNSNGQLGTGDNVNRLTPVHVANLIGVKDVNVGSHFSGVLMLDGTVRTWGKNNYGQLGIGNTENQLLPVEVSNLVGVKNIIYGTHYMFALLEDGTVKAWGFNYYGQLGLSHTVDIPIPVLVTLE